TAVATQEAPAKPKRRKAGSAPAEPEPVAAQTAVATQEAPAKPKRRKAGSAAAEPAGDGEVSR
ncbi:MAG: hypothetical protein ABSE70_08870, partial [Candidatus Limnocylindrales bacterium]